MVMARGSEVVLEGHDKVLAKTNSKGKSWSILSCQQAGVLGTRTRESSFNDLPAHLLLYFILLYSALWHALQGSLRV